jgi:serine/threonine protein kinase
MAHNLPQIITIDQFQVHLHQVLGQGGFGKVYKAYNNGRPFACKQIKVRHPSMFKCINQELNIMKKLNHPSLVSFTASYSLNNDIYIFMDFCNGGSLRQKLQIVHKKASLEDLALQVFCSILNSLK